jgi:peptidoglycan/LPS O-acetylase OafA/YrhL
MNDRASPRAVETGASSFERQSAFQMELLRGLAITGVVAIHTSGHFARAGAFSTLVVSNLIVDAFTHYAVPLFVLLSGMALALRYPSIGPSPELRAFYQRRLTRVIPPYVVFSLLYLALFAFEHEPSPASWVAFALLTGNAYYHLWFVALLIQLYVLFPAFLRLLSESIGRGHATGVLLAALLVQLLWNVLAPLMQEQLPRRPLIETLFSERVFLSHVFYFLLGLYAGRNLGRFDRWLRLPSLPVLALPSAALTAVVSAVWATAVRDYGSLGAAPAGRLIPAAAVEPFLHIATVALLWRLTARLAGGWSPLLGAVLAQLGALAFPIYLIHVFVQWLLARLLAGVEILPSGWPFYPILFFGTLLFSTAAAWGAGLLPFSEYLTGARTRPR